MTYWRDCYQQILLVFVLVCGSGSVAFAKRVSIAHAQFYQILSNRLESIAKDEVYPHDGDAVRKLSELSAEVHQTLQLPADQRRIQDTLAKAATLYIYGQFSEHAFEKIETPSNEDAVQQVRDQFQDIGHHFGWSTERGSEWSQLNLHYAIEPALGLVAQMLGRLSHPRRWATADGMRVNPFSQYPTLSKWDEKIATPEEKLLFRMDDLASEVRVISSRWLKFSRQPNLMTNLMMELEDLVGLTHLGGIYRLKHIGNSKVLYGELRELTIFLGTQMEALNLLDIERLERFHEEGGR